MLTVPDWRVTWEPHSCFHTVPVVMLPVCAPESIGCYGIRAVIRLPNSTRTMGVRACLGIPPPPGCCKVPDDGDDQPNEQYGCREDCGPSGIPSLGTGVSDYPWPYSTAIFTSVR